MVLFGSLFGGSFGKYDKSLTLIRKYVYIALYHWITFTSCVSTHPMLLRAYLNPGCLQ